MISYLKLLLKYSEHVLQTLYKNYFLYINTFDKLCIYNLESNVNLETNFSVETGYIDVYFNDNSVAITDEEKNSLNTISLDSGKIISSIINEEYSEELSKYIKDYLILNSSLDSVILF